MENVPGGTVDFATAMVQPTLTNVVAYVINGRQPGRAPLATHAVSIILVAVLLQGILPTLAAVGAPT